MIHSGKIPMDLETRNKIFSKIPQDISNTFKIDDSNEFLKECYNRNNYYEIILNESKLCFIFFSGNGLYFPNDYSTAAQVLLTEDRYEWENIAKSNLICNQAGKIIFVRDIYKTWYANGINAQVNSIDKLFYLLREKTLGYDIITVGNSAGGYMATLFGTLLSAKFIFNFSGQYVIYPEKLLDYYYLQKYKYGFSRAKYFDSIKYIRENPNIPIFYFYPAHCEEDKEQAALIGDINNIFSFKFNLSEHGRSMHGRDMPMIMVSEFDILKNLYDMFKDKIIEPDLFSFVIYQIYTLRYFNLKNEISQIIKKW